MTWASARSPKSSPNRSRSATLTDACERVASLLNCRRRYSFRESPSWDARSSIAATTLSGTSRIKMSVTTDLRRYLTISPTRRSTSAGTVGAYRTLASRHHNPPTARGGGAREPIWQRASVVATSRSPSPQRLRVHHNVGRRCGVTATGVTIDGTVVATHGSCGDARTRTDSCSWGRTVADGVMQSCDSGRRTPRAWPGTLAHRPPPHPTPRRTRHPTAPPAPRPTHNAARAAPPRWDRPCARSQSETQDSVLTLRPWQAD